MSVELKRHYECNRCGKPAECVANLAHPTKEDRPLGWAYGGYTLLNHSTKNSDYLCDRCHQSYRQWWKVLSQ
jgi:ribosomal protein L37E